ncbi:MAG: alanine--tRNA ligase [Acidobacteriia bacterium]|nr:alanine--tRNA ligase [Terriglobia bacterium]
MTSSEIRKRFLDFFGARDHRVVRSSSLVPVNDPTLLFSNAGMNQFKDVFLGREKRDYLRACSSQKCVRAGGKHNDLEQVGRTTRHHTFFEMLGNFSFGDYFKQDAIAWAWELVTKDFGIPPAKLYATVFREDDEAEELWVKIVARDRIFRFDEKDNFWQMGETGPCGPCSEIHYDLGPAASDLGHKDCPFPCDCGRYVELWNLVFMQFNRDEQGNMTPLPRPSIDTGAGLERFATVLQGKVSNFDTDLFRPLIQEAAELANVEYGANHDTDVSLRIIADHARASAFLISDGVLPSNEGRGYVLRLIMRRALYHGQTLGLNEPFLYKMAGQVVQMMKDAYPELLETEHHVTKAIKIEEEKYAHTTRIGLDRLDAARVWLTSGTRVTFREFKSIYPKDPAVTYGSVEGEDLFKLHDTFGLRPDFVEDVVKNYGLTVDRAGYEAEMAKQRERARASWKGAEKKTASPAYRELAEKQKSVFDGYQQVRSEGCQVVALIQKGHIVNEVKPGEEVEIVLDHTPFYAEAGGQVGDVGHFLSPDGTIEVAHIRDTYYPVSGLIAHKAVARDTLRVGDLMTAVVDAERRDAIRRNHTATHLLHAALRKTLGTHVKQAGSLVAPDRLRFDFSHYAAVDEQDLLDIEDLVNEHILKNEEVVTTVMDLDTAVNTGAMALFGEKYADKVRVLSINDFSKELCGGTHVRRTGDIGLFKVATEGSVAAGTRRIEALTGTGVLKELREASQTLALLSQSLRAKPEELVSAAEKLAEAEKKLRKQLESQQMKQAAAQAGDLVDQAKDVKGVRVVSARVDVPDRAAMRQMVDSLRPKLGSGVIVLGSVANGNVALVAAVSKDLTNRLDAGKIVKQAAALVEGSGGGRKDLAEAGGKNAAKLDESLAAIPAIIEKML